MNSCILVVDDETNITDVCSVYLQREGYKVITAGGGEEALRLWRQHSPHLIVLDLMMPGKNGWQVCEEIRNEQDVPIIMLTARGDEMDRLMGLTMGADDYMTKPFSPRELVLRVKAILRRQQRSQVEMSGVPAVATPGHILKFPGLELNVLHRSVRIHGKEIELTVKEFESIAKLKSARSRHLRAISSRTRMDQTCFGWRGFFCPTSNPLFQGRGWSRPTKRTSMADPPPTRPPCSLWRAKYDSDKIVLISIELDDRSCEGLRMSAPWWWGGRHEGPAYANLQRRKPREV